MLTAVRELQVALLAVLLLGGFMTKVWRVLRTRSLAAAMDPAALFPLRLRGPMVAAMGAIEFGLGVALIVTARRFGTVNQGLPATVVRVCAVLFFLVAMAALNETRQRRPEAGCGCFGEFSDTPIGWRTITRSGVLATAAALTIGLPPLRMPSSPITAELWLAVLAFELSLLAFLSPELGEVLVRLGYSEPCEVRSLPAGRTLTALHSSSQWRRYASQISAAAPADVWREGCWRFVVYPGVARDRRVDIVFAVYLQARRPPIRVAVLDADTDEILGRPELAVAGRN